MSSHSNILSQYLEKYQKYTASILSNSNSSSDSAKSNHNSHPNDDRETSDDWLESIISRGSHRLPEECIKSVIDALASLKGKSGSCNSDLQRAFDRLFVARGWKRVESASWLVETLRPAILKCDSCELSVPSERLLCSICEEPFLLDIERVLHQVEAHDDFSSTLTECTFCARFHSSDPRTLREHIYQSHVCHDGHIKCPNSCSTLIVRRHAYALEDHLKSCHDCQECDSFVQLEIELHNRLFHPSVRHHDLNGFPAREDTNSWLRSEIQSSDEVREPSPKRGRLISPKLSKLSDNRPDLKTGVLGPSSSVGHAEVIRPHPGRFAHDRPLSSGSSLGFHRPLALNDPGHLSVNHCQSDNQVRYIQGTVVNNDAAESELEALVDEANMSMDTVEDDCYSPLTDGLRQIRESSSKNTEDDTSVDFPTVNDESDDIDLELNLRKIREEASSEKCLGSGQPNPLTIASQNLMDEDFRIFPVSAGALNMQVREPRLRQFPVLPTEGMTANGSNHHPSHVFECSQHMPPNPNPANSFNHRRLDDSNSANTYQQPPGRPAISGSSQSESYYHSWNVYGDAATHSVDGGEVQTGGAFDHHECISQHANSEQEDASHRSTHSPPYPTLHSPAVRHVRPPNNPNTSTNAFGPRVRNRVNRPILPDPTPSHREKVVSDGSMANLTRISFCMMTKKLPGFSTEEVTAIYYSCRWCPLRKTVSEVEESVHKICPSCGIVLLSDVEMQYHVETNHGAPDCEAPRNCEFGPDCDFISNNTTAHLEHRFSSHGLCRQHLLCVNSHCHFLFSSLQEVTHHLESGRCPHALPSTEIRGLQAFTGIKCSYCVSCSFSKNVGSQDVLSCSSCRSPQFVDKVEFDYHTLSYHESPSSDSCCSLCPNDMPMSVEELKAHRARAHSFCSEHFRCSNPRCFLLLPSRLFAALHSKACRGSHFPMNRQPLTRCYDVLPRVLSLYVVQKLSPNSDKYFCLSCKVEVLGSDSFSCQICDREEGLFVCVIDMLFHLRVAHGIFFTGTLRCPVSRCGYSGNLKDIVCHAISLHKACSTHFACRSCMTLYRTREELSVHRRMCQGLPVDEGTESTEVHASAITCLDHASLKESPRKTAPVPEVLKFTKSAAEVDKLIFAPVVKAPVTAEVALHYNCPRCHISRLTKISVSKHVTCPCCNVVFLSLEEVRGHVQRMHGVEDVEQKNCTVDCSPPCQFVSSTPLDMIQHRKMVHGLCEEHLVCPNRGCGLLFTSPRLLTDHMRSNICSKQNNSKILELQTTTGADRPYHCASCDFNLLIDGDFECSNCDDHTPVKFPSRADLAIHSYLRNQNCEEMILLQCPDKESCPQKWFRLMEYFVHRDNKHRFCGMHYLCKNDKCRVAMPNLFSLQLHEMTCAAEPAVISANIPAISSDPDNPISIKSVVDKCCDVSRMNMPKQFKCTAPLCGSIFASSTLLLCKLCDITSRPVVLIDCLEYLDHLRKVHQVTPTVPAVVCSGGRSAAERQCRWEGAPSDVLQHRLKSHRVCSSHYTCTFRNCNLLFNSLESLLYHRSSPVHSSELSKRRNIPPNGRT